MPNYKMTLEKKKHILQLISWYWVSKYNDEDDYITHSDYMFLYNLWHNSLEVYDDDIQQRLNKIVNIYNKSNGIWKKVMKNG